jgi:hypothetical protein
MIASGLPYKRRPPIPRLALEPLLDAPQWYALSATACGMARRIVIHYWISGCRDLPRSDAELRGIALAPSGFAWKSAKPLIDELLAAVLPNLAKQYYWAIGRANKMRVARAKAAAGRLEHKQPAQDSYNLHTWTPEFPVAPSRAQFIPVKHNARPLFTPPKNGKLFGP